jgi:ERCC4-type nuclease
MKIIRDSRERNGWNFPLLDAEIITRKLDCGDYTTDLLENFVVIERKATATEIANNLGKRTAKARFYREFDRMQTLRKAYIVCEFPESRVYEFPKNSGMTPFQISKVKLNGNYIRKLMFQIEKDYPNIEIVFCNNRDEAESFTYDILSFWEKELT